MSQCLFLHITCSFVISSAFVTSSVKVHTVAVCFSSLQYCKDWSHLALDRGACHPHTVIIPELTSPLSIELLRRCRGHKIPCSERQHWSCPSGLEVKKNGAQKQTVDIKCLLSYYLGQLISQQTDRDASVWKQNVLTTQLFYYYY